MNKVAHYLQEHPVGEVMTAADARKYVSTGAIYLGLPRCLSSIPAATVSTTYMTICPERRHNY